MLQKVSVVIEKDEYGGTMLIVQNSKDAKLKVI